MTELEEGFRSLRMKYERSRSFYEASEGYSETETRTEFIDPFLRVLGWDVDNTANRPWGRREVIQERSQPREDSFAKKPDYTLMLEGVRKLHIEAKKPYIDIAKGTGPAFQARRYGYSDSAHHPIVVLTNYRQTAVYDATIPVDETTDDALTARKYFWTFDEYEDNAETINEILGKSSVASPEWDARVRSEESAQRLTADEAFVQWLNECRIRLAQDMLDTRHYDDATVINDSVQQLLNRLIFVRMCEDRGIEGENTLRDSGGGRDASLLALFKRLDERYNTGLFAVPHGLTDPVLCVKRKTLDDIIDHLYSPSSPYSFSVLDCDFLGLVYESCLVEHIVIGSDGKAQLARKKEYEHRDIVTTPQPLVDFTVLQSLSRIDESTDFPVILDFATGSGRFAVDAYRRCLERYAQRKGVWPLSFDEKKRLLTRNIFGIDIDYNAVEITKYGLLIALLDSESESTLPRGRKILPDLSGNIIHGNTLVDDVGEDDTKTDSVIPLDWRSAHLPDKFDLIIGNPPYMTTEHMRRYTGWEFAYYRSHYVTAVRQFDKYYTFIEKALSKLSRRGLLGVVVPNKWINNVSGSRLRSLLSVDTRIRLLANFRDHLIFPDQQVYVCVLVAQRGPSADADFAYEEPSSITSIPICEPLSIHADDLPRDRSAAWVLPASDSERSMLRAIHADSIPLREIVEARNGVQTSSNRVFIIKHPTLMGDSCVFSQNGREWNIETAITRPYLDDSRLIRSAHSLRADARIIFPYAVDKRTGEYRLYTEHEMRSLYPKALGYLLANKASLLKRDSTARGLMEKGGFYSYGRSQAIGYCMQFPKIFYSVNQSGDKYALDETGIVYQSGGTAGEVALFPRDGAGYSMDFILALLSQPEIETFLRKRGSAFQGAYYSRGTDVIKDVPVPNVRFDDVGERDWHDAVSSDFVRLRRCNDMLETAQPRSRAALQFQIAKLEDRIRKSFLRRWGLADGDWPTA